MNGASWNLEPGSMVHLLLLCALLNHVKATWDSFVGCDTWNLVHFTICLSAHWSVWSSWQLFKRSVFCMFGWYQGVRICQLMVARLGSFHVRRFWHVASGTLRSLGIRFIDVCGFSGVYSEHVTLTTRSFFYNFWFSGMGIVAVSTCDAFPPSLIWKEGSST